MDEIIMKTYKPPARVDMTKLDRNGNLVGKPLYNECHIASHGVCGSTTDWRAKANAKPLIVRNKVSDSFCL